jgi:hypothetical protein
MKKHLSKEDGTQKAAVFLVRRKKELVIHLVMVG